MREAFLYFTIGVILFICFSIVYNRFSSTSYQEVSNNVGSYIYSHSSQGGTVTIINGKSYSGNSVQILDDGTVKVDGVIQSDKIESKTVNVLVEGSVDSLETGSGTVAVKGGAGSVNTGSGNVSVSGDVGTNISTGSGSVKVEGSINGSASTGSGKVTANSIGGNVQTASGDVSASTISGSVRTVSGDIRK